MTVAVRPVAERLGDRLRFGQPRGGGAIDVNPDFVRERRRREARATEGEGGGEFLTRLLLKGFFGRTVAHEARRLLEQFLADELRRGAGLGLRQ